MPRGVFQRSPKTKARIKASARCRSCLWAWKPTTGFLTEKCPKCGKEKDVRDRKGMHVTPERFASMRAYRAKTPGYSRETSRRYRKTALLLVGDGAIKCVRCGCDRADLIEINHKRGGGAKELKGLGNNMVRNIALLRRAVGDLELLCKPCNAVHALELLHGSLPFTVVWGGK